MADLPAGGAEVILGVVVEVATETTGVVLIGAWNTHLQVGTPTPQYLQADVGVEEDGVGLAFHVDVGFLQEGQGHHLIVDLHYPVLQQLHHYVSYEHGHLLGPGHSLTPTVVIGNVDAEVSALTVLCQHVGTRPLEVQHAAVEGAVVGVPERYAGGGAGQAVGAAHTWDQGRGLIRSAGQQGAAFAVAVNISRHAGAAGALIHLPLLARYIDLTLVHTRHARGLALIAAFPRSLHSDQAVVTRHRKTLLDAALHEAQIAGTGDTLILDVCPALTIRHTPAPSLQHTLITDGAAGVWGGELLVGGAAELQAALVETCPRQVLALAGEAGVICGQDLVTNQSSRTVTEGLCTDRTAGVRSREEDVAPGTVHQAGALLTVAPHMLLPIWHHLTRADLTRITNWVEAVSWAIHSALKHTVCTHWAALSRHADGVDAGGETAYLGAGSDSAHTHAGHAGGGVCKPAAAFLVLLSIIHTPSASWTAGSRISHLMQAGQLRTLRRHTLNLPSLAGTC